MSTPLVRRMDSLSQLSPANEDDQLLETGWIDWAPTRLKVSISGPELSEEGLLTRHFSSNKAPTPRTGGTLCRTLGSQCGPVFEARYASFRHYRYHRSNRPTLPGKLTVFPPHNHQSRHLRVQHAHRYRTSLPPQWRQHARHRRGVWS